MTRGSPIVLLFAALFCAGALSVLNIAAGRARTVALDERRTPVATAPAAARADADGARDDAAAAKAPGAAAGGNAGAADADAGAVGEADAAGAVAAPAQDPSTGAIADTPDAAGVRDAASGAPADALNAAVGPPAVRDAVVAAAGQVGELVAASLQTRTAAAERRRAAARRAAHRAELRKLRRSRSVAGALRRAWLAEEISAGTYRGLQRAWAAAVRDRDRLPGRRRAELQAVINVVAGLAATRQLTASRLEPVFLTLRRNREYWTARPLPAPGARMTFGRDPVIFQYYAGRGLQIQPLASFGHANALLRSCLQLDPQFRCRRAAVKKLLDRMVALGARRGGFVGWEYYFAFGGGTPPWISAMTQATGAQALERGHRALGDPRYGTASRRALGAFEQAPPVGVSVRVRRGRRYPMYSFRPRLRILNGELQAVIGLRDVFTLTGSRRARGLYARAERVARASVRSFDTGAWSLYSAGGEESTLDYHRLVTDFLAGLCQRTGRRTYCATAERFERYEREPPRVKLRRLRWLRARKPVAIRLHLSKVSDVTIHVRGRRGLEVRRTLRLQRGRHRLRWVPATSGRHRLRIVAVGPGGTRGYVVRTLHVRSRASSRERP